MLQSDAAIPSSSSLAHVRAIVVTVSARGDNLLSGPAAVMAVDQVRVVAEIDGGSGWLAHAARMRAPAGSAHRGPGPELFQRIY